MLIYSICVTDSKPHISLVCSGTQRTKSFQLVSTCNHVRLSRKVIIHTEIKVPLMVECRKNDYTLKDMDEKQTFRNLGNDGCNACSEQFHTRLIN